MTDEAPAPLVPAEVDLRGYEFMPLYGDRLKDSDTNSRATDAEFRAALNLWWSAWKQEPAASLPDDDVTLCKLADLGRDLKAWKRVREVAMRGFVQCSDGRWYHRVLAPLAIDAWEARKLARAKGINGASKRWANHKHKKDIAQASKKDSTGNATTTKNDSKGEERILKALEVKSPTRGDQVQNHEDDSNSTPPAQCKAVDLARSAQQKANARKGAA